MKTSVEFITGDLHNPLTSKGEHKTDQPLTVEALEQIVSAFGQTIRALKKPLATCYLLVF